MVNVIEVQGLIDALKDVTGIKGDTGATPNITITATADALSSDNPSVTVTKTGTAEEPSFALAFSGLKGAPGAGGDYYAPTQVLSLNAYPSTESYDYVGYYSVVVKSTGTAEEKKIKPGYIVVADIVINDSGITTIKNNINITPYIFESGVTNGTLLFPSLDNLKQALVANKVLESDYIRFTTISAINIYYA